mgnify:CR=1 FL=1
MLAAMSVAVSADGIYVAGALGQSKANLECDGTTVCDDADIGFKMLVGSRITPTIALEAGYVNFGKVSMAGNYGGYQAIAAFESHGMLVNGAFRYAATPAFSLVGRVGISVLRTTVSGAVAGYSNVSDDKVAVSPYLGLGMEYALTKTLRLTADADFTEAEGELRGNSDSASVQLMSIGLQYAF